MNFDDVLVIPNPGHCLIAFFLPPTIRRNGKKSIGSLDELVLEESAWSFMALDSIFKMLENRESRGDRRVNIAGNTGLPRKKS